MFEIQSKIVCVDDFFLSAFIRSRFAALPIKGRVYTVRDIVPGVEPDLKATAAVLLVEIVSPPNVHGIEPGFAPWRFVPLEEVATVAAQEAERTLGSFSMDQNAAPVTQPQKPCESAGVVCAPR